MERNLIFAINELINLAFHYPYIIHIYKHITELCHELQVIDCNRNDTFKYTIHCLYHYYAALCKVQSQHVEVTLSLSLAQRFKVQAKERYTCSVQLGFKMSGLHE